MGKLYHILLEVPHNLYGIHTFLYLSNFPCGSLYYAEYDNKCDAAKNVRKPKMLSNK